MRSWVFERFKWKQIGNLIWQNLAKNESETDKKCILFHIVKFSNNIPVNGLIHFKMSKSWGGKAIVWCAEHCIYYIQCKLNAQRIVLWNYGGKMCNLIKRLCIQEGGSWKCSFSHTNHTRIRFTKKKLNLFWRLA